MTKATNLDILVAYKGWADAVFYQAISKLTDEELRQNRSMLFDNIFALLNHVYSMDVVWKSHLEGKSHSFETRNPKNSCSLFDLQQDQVKVNNWYKTYIGSLTVEECNEVIQFQFIGGGEGRMSRIEIIQHVVNHGSYHRGHLEGVLYQLSVEPPTTDFPVFLRQIRS